MNYRLILFAGVLLISSCHKSHPSVDTRPFYMGVTPWPSDFTAAAVDEAYNFINNQCDMVSHHFDEGIPYEEAYRHLAWPQELQKDVAARKQKTGTGKKILLSVAPLNLTRHQKADYYRMPDGITDSIKNAWAQLPVNDPKVIQAYISYVSYLVDELHPDWVNYGVESNDGSWDGAGFNAYKDFLSGVYTALRTRYPSVPFFISFMVNDEPAFLYNAAALISVTDYIGLSAYPYISSYVMSDGNTDPKRLANDFFTRFIELDASKPWAFAETGYLAQDLSIPAFSLYRTGSSQWQTDYLNIVLTLCRNRKAKFFVWFCSSDYDAAVIRMQQTGQYQDLFGLWKDTGLKDENHQTRSSYGLWQTWMGKGP